MPQKINHAGEMQNYVPSGNPAGGQWGDSETGSNKNWKAPKEAKEAKEAKKSKEEPKEDKFEKGLKKGFEDKPIEPGSFEEEAKKWKENALKRIDDKAKERGKKTFSDYIEKSEIKDKDYFFGENEWWGKGYFHFKHYRNDDEIMIATNNIEYYPSKDVYVMRVDNDKVVYLKNWQLRQARSWNGGDELHGFLVKLNRKYFKPYRSFVNDKFSFDKEDTFDDLVKLAKEQDKEDLEWTFHHANQDDYTKERYRQND